MSLSVRCILCLNKFLDQLEKLATQENWTNEKLETKRETLIESTAYEIRSKLISKNEMESMQALGMELANHLQAIHNEELQRIGILQVHFNGFNVMKYFETKDEDSLFEQEKEKMREKLLEEVMMFAPDDEDDEDEDEIDEDFDFEDDEDEESEVEVLS
jgi:hypothetical protein